LDSDIVPDRFDGISQQFGTTLSVVAEPGLILSESPLYVGSFERSQVSGVTIPCKSHPNEKLRRENEKAATRALQVRT